MGFLKRLFGSNTGDASGDPVPANEPDIYDASTGAFTVEVVGESKYQSAIAHARKTLMQTDHKGRPCLPVRVECEPSNPKDKNAVVIKTTRGDRLGYLPRVSAAEYCKRIAGQGGVVICRAALIGGDEERPAIGLWLDLARAKDIRKTPAPGA